MALGASRIFTYRTMPEHTGAAPAAQSPRPLLDTLAGNLPSCDSCLTSATPKSTGCNQKQHTSEDSEAWHQVPSQRSSSAGAPPAARRCGLSSGPAQPQKGAPQCTPESCKRALPGLLQPHGAYKAQRGTNWGCLQKWPCALVRTSGYSTCVQVEACSCHVMCCSSWDLLGLSQSGGGSEAMPRVGKASRDDMRRPLRTARRHPETLLFHCHSNML